MKIAKTANELSVHVLTDNIGFIPTMGALHDGHTSLVRASKARGLFTVASIFVNPTQFNNPDDFAKYPVDLDSDISKLRKSGCDLLYAPSVSDVYPKGMDLEPYTHDFGILERVYEGAFRPGHFRGVGMVVHRLFELVRPSVAYFGQKDIQQIAVIRKLVQLLNVPIEIADMPTIRESGGLAMSSRNRRLSGEEKNVAHVLFEALSIAKSNKNTHAPETIKNEVQELFDKSQARLEYFDIVDERTFEPASALNQNHLRAIIAAYVGEVRLIDNMPL